MGTENTNQVVVSIIMSVYNGEQFLREAIESVINQSFSKWELIITDDNSSDNSAEIIREYLARDKRIKLLVNEINDGLTVSLNRMLKYAKGKYVARLDSDDVCLPNRLEKEVKYLENNKKVFMVCSYAMAIGSKMGVIKTVKNSERLKASLLFANSIVHSTIMFRNNYDYYYDESCKKAQDVELWDRFEADGKRIHVIDKPLVMYRYHDKQISTTAEMEQSDVMNMVRKRALSRIGIEISSDLTNSINKYLKGKVITAEELGKLIELFDNIIKKNNHYSYYNKKALKKVIKGEYSQIYLLLKKNKKCLPLNIKLLIIRKAFGIRFVKRLLLKT